MANGKKTAPDKIKKFKAAMLITDNVQDAAKMADLNINTAYDYKDKLMQDEEFLKEKEKFKSEFITDAHRIIKMAANVVTEKIGAASAASAATIAAIYIDKTQLLQGEPTAITKDDISATKLTDLDTQLQQLIDKYPHLKGKIS